MAFKNVPTGVLAQIVSYLPVPDHLPELAACVSVSKSLSAVAIAELYREIDLRVDSGADETTSHERQSTLLRSIANNPEIGSQVNSFRGNGDVSTYQMFADGAEGEDEDVEILIRAASNMKSLARAHLFTGPLPTHIVTNAPLYTNLVDLTVNSLHPSAVAWPQSTLPLKSLKWTIPTIRIYGNPMKDPWAAVQLLESMLQATAPQLESLDIWFDNNYSSRREDTNIPSPHAQQYLDLPKPSTTNLKMLQHFGMKVPGYGAFGDNTPFEIDYYHDFVSRHRETLTSLALDRTDTAYVLQICALVPKVKTLSLLETLNAPTPDMSIVGPALSSPNYEIESFSLHDSGMTFGTKLASLFSSWKSLKSLRLGDHDLKNTQYGDDGRLDIGGYTNAIVGFFWSLPKTVEELYLELNGEDLMLDEDKDFDPMCYIGGTIFLSQDSLRSVDIQGWFSNLDGGLGSIPEKAVFYRRLAGEYPGQKEIWTSRMDCIYQEDNATVTTKRERLDGCFKGEDEKEPWLEGYEFPRKEKGGTGRGSPADATDFDWPGWKPMVTNYPGFKKKSLE